MAMTKGTSKIIGLFGLSLALFLLVEPVRACTSNSMTIVPASGTRVVNIHSYGDGLACYWYNLVAITGKSGTPSPTIYGYT